MPKGKIKITKNGPYLVTGLPLSEYEIVVNEAGESVEWKKSDKQYAIGDKGKESYALCRCGGSSNKPFCTGAHLANGFDGTETAKRGKYEDMAERIEGPEYDLLSQDELCSGARFCDAGKKTWNLVNENDISPEQETFLQQCADCPSGRFTAADKNGKMIEPQFEPEVIIVNDPACRGGGPIWVRGGAEIESADGHIYEARNRVTLCRCGRSGNKPFCDGSHFEIEG